MDDLPQYTIGTVARRTGLSTHLIRAWERRYAVVDPGRSEGGTRLYSAADIQRLQLLRQATERGVAIGQAARLGTDELMELAGGPAGDPSVGPTRSSWQSVEALQLAVLGAIETMDAERIRANLMRALVSLGVAEFTNSVAVPLLHRVGELWQKDELCPAQEHLFSVQLRSVLEWLLESLPVPRSALGVIATTLSGESHELGAMLAGVTAAREGWRVTYLGPDLPVTDIATAARLTGSQLVLVSAVSEAAGEALQRQLTDLKAALPPEVLILAGGMGAGVGRDRLHAAGIRCLSDLDALADTLNSLSPGPRTSGAGRP